MSKITKTIAALGVVAGLGVAALPLASYADEDSKTINIAATISDSIAVAVTNGEVGLAVTNSAAPADNSGTPVGINVKSNGANGYTLSLSGNTTLASGGNTIEYGSPAAGTSAWAYKFGTAAEISSASWAPSFTGTANLKSTGEAGDVATGDDYQMIIGVSANSSQPAGTYKNTLTVTATTK